MAAYRHGDSRENVDVIASHFSFKLHDVRDFFGHANITTTSRYLRSTPVRLARALERLEGSAETVVDADEQAYLVEVR